MSKKKIIALIICCVIFAGAVYVSIISFNEVKAMYSAMKRYEVYNSPKDLDYCTGWFVKYLIIFIFQIINMLGSFFVFIYLIQKPDLSVADIEKYNEYKKQRKKDKLQKKVDVSQKKLNKLN